MRFFKILMLILLLTCSLFIVMGCDGSYEQEVCGIAYEYVSGGNPKAVHMDNFKLYADGTGICNDATVYLRLWRTDDTKEEPFIHIQSSDYVSLDYNYCFEDGLLKFTNKKGYELYYKPVRTFKGLSKYEEKYGY